MMMTIIYDTLSFAMRWDVGKYESMELGERSALIKYLMSIFPVPNQKKSF